MVVFFAYDTDIKIAWHFRLLNYSALERNSTYLKCTKYIYGKSPRFRMSILAFSLVHFYVLKKVSSFLKSTSLKQNAILVCHCIALPMRGYAIGGVDFGCCIVDVLSFMSAKIYVFGQICKFIYDCYCLVNAIFFVIFRLCMFCDV